MLNDGKMVYGDFRSFTDESRLLERVPDEGIVCWAGVIYVRNPPKGERTSVFRLKMIEVKPLNLVEVGKLLAEPDPSRIEASREATNGAVIC